jgi:hypothetical protein
MATAVGTTQVTGINSGTSSGPNPLALVGELGILDVVIMGGAIVGGVLLWKKHPVLGGIVGFFLGQGLAFGIDALYASKFTDGN